MALETAAMIESLIVQVLVPFWWEIKMSVAASLFVIAAYWFFTYGTAAAGDDDADRSLLEVSDYSVYAGSKEMVESALRAHSISVKGSRRHNKNPEVNASKTEKL